MKLAKFITEYPEGILPEWHDFAETYLSEAADMSRTQLREPAVTRTAEMHGGHAHEIHEQFVRRASRVFPEDQVNAWSRIDRAVFNHLMSQLIYRHSYSAISNEMLQEVRTETIKIVKGLTDN